MALHSTDDVLLALRIAAEQGALDHGVTLREIAAAAIEQIEGVSGREDLLDEIETLEAQIQELRDYVDELEGSETEPGDRGVGIIATERKRQVVEEGWTASHDALHDRNELVEAAACYALPERLRSIDIWDKPLLEWLWPFRPCHWKPTRHDRVRELAKAGALIAAEIDRIQAEEAGDA